MTALCAGKDPEMWSPASADARLAMAICRRCTGCPDNDPKPHGVIRQGVPYGDSGQVIPPCPACTRPQVDYRGGAVTPCRLCAVPDVAIPDPGQVRASRVRWLVKLGADHDRIALDLGVRVTYVPHLIRRSNARTSTPTREGEAA